MMPERSHKKIRSVNIHYGSCIHGFSFLDKEGTLLWEIGDTDSDWDDVDTVLLAENEVIVGVVAKLSSVCQSSYTSFQFQIAAECE